MLLGFWLLYFFAFRMRGFRFFRKLYTLPCSRNTRWSLRMRRPLRNVYLLSRSVNYFPFSVYGLISRIYVGRGYSRDFLHGNLHGQSIHWHPLYNVLDKSKCERPFRPHFFSRVTVVVDANGRIGGVIQWNRDEPGKRNIVMAEHGAFYFSVSMPQRHNSECVAFWSLSPWGH